MMDILNEDRTLGENTDDEDNEERGRLLLEQLKAKIELRRKQRKKEKIVPTRDEFIDTNTNVQDEEDKSLSKHTAEAEENDQTDGLNSEVTTVNEEASEEPRVKKKKKRKRELPSSDEDENEEVSPQPEDDVAPGEGFTVLGVDHFEKKPKIKRVLPHWLANPSVISVNLQHLTTGVDEIASIDPGIRKRLKKKGITHFFPVQCQVIPWLISTLNKPIKYWPQDVCVSAPTGSGKTLAFVIPVVQALKNRVVPHIRAVAVLPSQDLALQVKRVFKTYCTGTKLKVVLTTGKRSFQVEQKRLVRKGIISGPQSLVDIVVTTPGRLVDHIKFTPGFSLKHLRFLIIDEADRVMESIDNDWLHHVNKHIQSLTGQMAIPRLDVETLNTLPPPPQKLLFSATLSQDPEKLQQLGLFQPKLFTSVVEGKEEPVAGSESRGDFVGKYTTPAELSEKICVITEMNKPLVLYHLMMTTKMRHVLCFTNSQVEAHRLYILLGHLARGQFSVAEISAALDPLERKDILAQFIDEKIDILVSTNALARGIDIPTVDYVVSYRAQKYIKNYIHQVGRTGRAGRKGTAITFVQKKEKARFEEMIKNAGKSLDEELQVTDEELEQYSDVYHKAIEDMKHDIEKEKSEVLQSSKEQKRSRQPQKKQRGHSHGEMAKRVVRR